MAELTNPKMVAASLKNGSVPPTRPKVIPRREPPATPSGKRKAAESPIKSPRKKKAVPDDKDTNGKKVLRAVTARWKDIPKWGGRKILRS